MSFPNGRVTLAFMNFEIDHNLTLTGADFAAREAYAFYADQLLGYGPELRQLFEAAEKAPTCGMIAANCAILHMAFEGLEGWDLAAPYLSNMRAQVSLMTEREQMFCAGVEAWAQKDWQDALNKFATYAENWPHDLVAIKWGQYHAFNLGDQAALLHFGELALKASPGKPYVHGLIAFGLEQNHFIKEAEHHAMKAAEIAIDDAWAHHAVAHVMEATGRPEEGARWLAHCDHIWDQKGTFIREHNWWHAGLFQLAIGDHARAMEIFDEKLWGEWPEFPQEQIGAASMLWRMELHGIDVGDRWTPVATKAKERVEDRLLPFHDLHYLFALTRGGHEAESKELRNAIAHKASNCCAQSAPAWQAAALPAADGIIAFAQGDYNVAASHLMKASQTLEKIGGSHAQRGIFADTVKVAQKNLQQRIVS